MIRNTLAFLLLIFLFGCSTANEKDKKNQNDDFNQAALAFSELKPALDKEDGKLWDHSLEGTLMLVDRNSRFIIANEPDNKNELKKQGDFFVGYLPDNVNIANTSIDWNGKHWTMVMLPLPDTKEERLNLLIHESFHRIQPLIGFDSLYQTHNDHLNAKDGRIWLKMELEALKNALKSEKPEKNIMDALIFRQYRDQIFPGTEQTENALELKEGLAEYTGSILSGRSDSALKKHYVSRIDDFYNYPTFVRSFAYVTIPVYGYFMQKTDKKWNLSVNKNTNLTDLIDEFFGVKPLNFDSNKIVQLAKNYGYDSIYALETTRELKRQALITKYKKLFLGDSVVSIDLENMHIGFDPRNIMPLDSFGTVYPNLRVTDNWGILEVDSDGALLNPSWNHITISYPEVITDTLISGSGWKLKLNNSWKLEKTGVKYELKKK